ncbi:MAG: hypothetical protein H0W82_07250 [Actinobacteria bacterium]|nr:hypothetical protein [Actinomycetota bacterium]
MFEVIPRRSAMVLLSVLLVAGPMLIAIPTASVANAASCGEWRWPVKTLSDSQRRQVDFDARRITIRRLRRLDSPGPYDGMPRTGPVENRTYRVLAQVVGAKLSEDGDIHLVIAARTAKWKMMIVEFPAPRCVDKEFRRPEMRRARQQVLNNCGPISSSSFTDLRGRVTVQGVGFWDNLHGLTREAPNGIELHPVLSFRGTCSPR